LDALCLDSRKKLVNKDGKQNVPVIEVTSDLKKPAKTNNLIC